MMKKYLLYFLLAAFIQNPVANLMAQPIKNPVDYVNPFIGTINYGATNPGAVCPMGLASVVPFNVTGAEGNVYNMNEGWCSTPYWHLNKILTGFSHINFSSVGCPDLGSILLMPITGDLIVDHRIYGSEYSDESASPGYYRTRLQKYDVVAEMTATKRTGISKYTFPEGESHIVLNLGLGLTNETGAFLQRISDTEVEGFKMMGSFCYNPQEVFPVYFAVRVSKKPNALRYWKFHQKLEGDKHEWSSTSDRYKIYTGYRKELGGDNIGVAFSYQTQPGEVIMVQVGLSLVSTDNAWENLNIEQQSGSRFDEIHEQAVQEWSRYLNTIQVEGGTEQDREMFYTAFYHTLLHPNVLNDNNGQYPGMGSGEIKNLSAAPAANSQSASTRYTMFSLWDTYRNVHPLKSIVFPDHQLEMVRSILGMFEESGALPKWEYAGQNYNVMEGDPALIVISDTYMRGLRDFDTDLAWKAMSHHAFSAGPVNKVRPDNDFYMKNHYVPILKDYDNSVSQAVEYYAADYALSKFAAALGKKDTANILFNRSLGYKKYFDASHGLLRPVQENGEFFDPFDPLMGQNFAPSHGFHEGTSWNYSFALPHDMNGLQELLGGGQALAKKLSECFEKNYFDMTNEPDIGYPWYFNFIRGEEWRTQKHVDACMNQWFSTKPDGLPGNDDAGTLSSWLMFAMMGIYPVIPGEPIYSISTPRFSKITIRLNTDYYPSGELIISTDKDPVTHRQLRDKKFFITHEELTTQGLRLRLK